MNSKNWHYPFPQKYPNAPVSMAGGVKRDFAEHLRRKPKSTFPGDDYATPMGTPVYAPFDGDLGDFTEPNGGLYAVLIGDGVRIDFLHMKSVNIQNHKWRKVKKGEVIGTTGNSGKRTTGPHCHVSIRTRRVGNSWSNFIPTEEHFKNAYRNTYQQPKPIEVVNIEIAKKELDEKISQDAIVNKTKEVELTNKIVQLEQELSVLKAQEELELSQLEEFIVDEVSKQPTEAMASNLAIDLMGFVNEKIDKLPRSVRIALFGVVSSFLVALTTQLAGISPEQVFNTVQELTRQTGIFAIPISASAVYGFNILLDFIRELSKKAGDESTQL